MALGPADWPERCDTNVGSDAESRRAHCRSGTGRAGGRNSRPTAWPRIFDRREGCARQLDLQISDEHGVFHHTGAARDWRDAAGVALRQTDAHRGAPLLPARRRSVRSSD